MPMTSAMPPDPDDPAVPSDAAAFLRLCGLNTTAKPDVGEASIVTVLPPADLVVAAERWPHLVPTGDLTLQRDLSLAVALENHQAGRASAWRIVDIYDYERWCTAQHLDPAAGATWQAYPGVATVISATRRSSYAIPLAYHIARIAAGAARHLGSDPLALIEASTTMWQALLRICSGGSDGGYGLLLVHVTGASPAADLAGGELQLFIPDAASRRGPAQFPDLAEQAIARLAVALGYTHTINFGLIGFDPQTRVEDLVSRNAPGVWYQMTLSRGQVRPAVLAGVEVGSAITFDHSDGPWASGQLRCGDSVALLRSALEPPTPA